MQYIAVKGRRISEGLEYITSLSSSALLLLFNSGQKIVDVSWYPTDPSIFTPDAKFFGTYMGPKFLWPTINPILYSSAVTLTHNLKPEINVFWRRSPTTTSTPKMKFYAQDYEMLSSGQLRDTHNDTTMNL